MRLDRLAVRHPKTVIAACLLLTLAMLPGVARITFDTDGRSLLPRHSPEIDADAEIRARYGIDDPLAVVVHVPDSDPTDVFTPARLQLVSELTARLQEIPAIGSRGVESLATECADRVRPGTLEFQPFLEPRPETQVAADRVRDDVRRIGIYTGTLVSDDSRATSIVVDIAVDQDRVARYASIAAVVDRMRSESASDVGVAIDIVGAPAAESLLGAHLLADLGVPPSWQGLPDVAREPTESGATESESCASELMHRIGLLPILLAVMFAVFLIAFRRLAAAALPLIEVGAALAFVFGLMGYGGMPVYLTTAVLPIILCAVGVQDEVHVFSRYRTERRRGLSAAAALERAMDELRGPITKTSATTALGFLTFTLSPVPAVASFGAFTAIGIVYCWLFSLTAIPAALTLLPDRRSLPRDSRTSAKASLSSWVAWPLRLRIAILIGALLLVVVLPMRARDVMVQDSWLSGFAESNALRRATEFVNARFDGTHQLLIEASVAAPSWEGSVARSGVAFDHVDVPIGGADPERVVGSWITLSSEPTALHRIVSATRVDAELVRLLVDRRDGSLRSRHADSQELRFEIRRRPFLEPEVISAIDEFAGFVRTRRQDAVGGVLAPGDYLRTIHYMTQAGRERYRKVPETPRAVRELWRRYASLRGEVALGEIVDDERQRAIVRVFLKDANYTRTERLIAAIRRHEREHLRSLGIRLELGGDVAVSESLIGGIVATQMRSLLASLIGVLLLTSLLARSLAIGLCCVLPSAMAVFANFALMATLDIPLGVATSMFAAMAIGIGVDAAVHLTERARRQWREGLGSMEAARRAVAECAPALVVDGIAISAGFGMLTLSSVPANARLGLLVVTSVVMCLVLSLILLPVLLSYRRVPRVLEDGMATSVATTRDTVASDNVQAEAFSDSAARRLQEETRPRRLLPS